MRRVGTQLLIVLLLVSWLAPAAVASYVSPIPPCCRRAGHHCPRSVQRAFRDAKLHCRSCQSLVTATQAPRLTPVTIAIALHDEHPFVHEFSSAPSSVQSAKSRSQRAPPSSER